MRRHLAVSTVLVISLTSLGAGADLGPESVPDLPVLGQRAYRGNDLVTRALDPIPPTSKVVDGQIDDWVGEITRIGGTALYSAGEYVYQDYVMDDWGADDGIDAQRNEVTGPMEALIPETARIEILAQAAGEQFGAPPPIGVPVHYGDADPQGELRDQSDIEEVRLAADATHLSLLVRTTGMRGHGRTAVVLFVDDPATDAVYAGMTIPTTQADYEFLIIGDAITQWRSGATVSACPCASFEAASNPDDYINAVEASIPLSTIGNMTSIHAGVATAAAEDGAIASVAPPGVNTELINVAFRFDEPAAVWMDRQQALSLFAGTVDGFFTPVDLDRLRAGDTEGWELRAGYYERVYESDSIVNSESPTGFWQGSFQHYGLYVPTAYRPGRALPATWWTHYRGGHAHDAAAWLPGLLRHLGEARSNIMIMPSARGTSTWYVGRGHEDFLEVWDDSMASFDIDPDRVYMSGYSMGGFASWLLPLLYPDRFAASFPTAGPPTQGLWDGVGLVSTGANDGRPAEQLTFDIIGNATNVGYVMYHGTNDELVPVTGPIRMASELTLRGLPNRLYLFPGAEHYTNAIYDEWTEAAAYLDTFVRDPSPPRVSYTVKPSLELAVEEVNTPSPLSYSFDGAYWVDGLVVRDGDPTAASTLGTIDATTFGRGMPTTIGIPEASTGGQLAPHVMTGLRMFQTGRVTPRNSFTAQLINLARAELDLTAMALSTGEPIEASISSDGPATVFLKGAWSGTPVIGGATVATSMVGGGLEIQLDGGTFDLVIRPA